jgi:hypothetical protein
LPATGSDESLGGFMQHLRLRGLQGVTGGRQQASEAGYVGGNDAIEVRGRACHHICGLQ